MRRLARLIIAIAIVLVLTAAALYLLRKPITEAAVERVMANAGLLNPAVAVADVSLSELSLRSMRAGQNPSSPDLLLSDVVFDFDWRALLFDGEFRKIAITKGAVAAALGEGGRIDVAGWSPDPTAKAGAPPFGALQIDTLRLTAETPKGLAEIELSGAFDFTSGGRFDIRASADAAGFAAASMRRLSGEGAVALDADGAIGAEAAFTGDLVTPIGVADNLDAKLVADLASWRGFFGEGARPLAGEARIAVRSATIDAAAPAFAPLASTGGEPIRRISAAGELVLSFDGGAFSVAAGAAPLTILADRGDRLVVAGGDGLVYESRDGARRLSLSASLEGPVASGQATIDAVSENAAPWRVKASANFGEQRLASVTFASFEGKFDGEFAQGRAAGDAEMTALIKSAEVGRLRVSDTPVHGNVDLTLDLTARSIAASPQGDRCLDVERAQLRLEGQDTDAQIVEAMLCPATAPLIKVTWGADAKTHVEGALQAKSARYRLGETVFDGAPPKIDFTLDYEPALETSRIAGDLSGGAVILNKAFVLSNAKGTFETVFVRDSMRANATLSTMMIAQNAELEMVAPVAVAGGASLADEVARFDFKVTTPNGRRLGEGAGEHQVKTGIGEAVFDSGRLDFTLGLQPDRIMPALRGVISAATGAAEGRARFAWTTGAMDSAATMSFDDLSFRGPGVAVTRTEGVTGKVVLTDLDPLQSGGEQTLSIRKIDLDALKLENGRMRYSLPGDETLNIVEAEFPWFGGTIGAYDSRLPIGGGKAETTLQIDNVDFSALLNYINVDGLSGAGTIEGVLPLSVEGGRARINDGVLSSKGSGVVRYQGKTTDAASQSSEQSALAFEILRELRFDKLSATIDGPLDGTLNFKIFFEGRSDIPVRTGKKTQRVDSPVKYRLTINAPLLSLIEQAILSTDVRLQIDRARDAAQTEPE